MTDIAIGTLELKWPDLVRDVAFNIASQFINGGAPESEHMDEFLIRQALREALVRHLSTSIVTMKEARYEADKGSESSRRLDLTVGFPKRQREVAIEIKNTRAKKDEIKDDWIKISSEPASIKLSLVGGVTQDARKIDDLEKFKLTGKNGEASARLIHHPIRVPFKTHSDKKESIAFAMLWAIGKTDDELNPKIGYTVSIASPADR